MIHSTRNLTKIETSKCRHLGLQSISTCWGMTGMSLKMIWLMRICLISIRDLSDIMNLRLILRKLSLRSDCLRRRKICLTLINSKCTDSRQMTLLGTGALSFSFTMLIMTQSYLSQALMILILLNSSYKRRLIKANFTHLTNLRKWTSLNSLTEPRHP